MKFTQVHPFDELFTHVADDDGQQTSYNVSALYTHITAHPSEVTKTTVQVDEEHARYCIERRGVEKDRIAVLMNHVEYLKKPVVFVVLPDESYLLVDGTHRYVVYFAAKALQIPAYIVPWAVAAPFVVEDMPRTPEDELMAWSGLTVMRQLQKQ